MSPPAMSHSGSAARLGAGRILYSEEGAELGQHEPVDGLENYTTSRRFQFLLLLV